MAIKLDYANKVILAPMVRICTLPTRLAALEYGADLVYCEEIIDYKILTAKRVENECLGTVDYILPDETVVFRTCPKEKEKLVFQLGTANAARALQAAKKVEKDVSGIDINMGCPKEFSIKGGMGAALLRKPEVVKEILTTLVKSLTVPVTCKIRVRPKLEDTLSLVKLIESTGVSAVAVHGRTTDERPRHPNRNDVIKAIANAVNIPVIANGGSKEIINYEDIEKFRQQTGTSSVMVARAAQWNCSIFRKEGKLPLHDVIKNFLRYAIKYDNNPINSKYCILQMMHETMKDPEGQAMLGSFTTEDICGIWKMGDLYHETVRTRKEKRKEPVTVNTDAEMAFKRRKTDDGGFILVLPVRFQKKNYPPAVSPKQCLHDWCKRNYERAPHYHTVDRNEDRCFNSVMTLRGQKYTTPFWEKSKQIAEQGAAIACLITMGLPDGRIADENEMDAFQKKWNQFVQCSEETEKLKISETRHKSDCSKLDEEDVVQSESCDRIQKEISDEVSEVRTPSSAVGGSFTEHEDQGSKDEHPQTGSEEKCEKVSKEHKGLTATDS